MAAEVIPYSALKKGVTPIIAGGQPLPPDGCVLCYGTYPFAQQILLHHRWSPGAWCSDEKLDCGTYYPHFRSHLLNQHFEILTGIEAIRDTDRLFTEFGSDDRVFARPTSAHKLFVGRCIDRESFASALAPTRYDPTSQVVIAKLQPIDREWRLVVVGERVVAGSQYAENGVKKIVAECPLDVISFAELMLAEVRWRPDPAFMPDMCESAGRLWLVELNSFSGSWLYRCDLAAVVSAASELAEEIGSRR